MASKLAWSLYLQLRRGISGEYMQRWRETDERSQVACSVHLLCRIRTFNEADASVATEYMRLPWSTAEVTTVSGLATQIHSHSFLLILSMHMLVSYTITLF